MSLCPNSSSSRSLRRRWVTREGDAVGIDNLVSSSGSPCGHWCELSRASLSELVRVSLSVSSARVCSASSAVVTLPSP
jgi:hypothetical protein